jgi:uncharacterized membrane protein SirB2
MELEGNVGLIKIIHLTAVALTISGFIVRGILLLRGSSLIRGVWVRKAPHMVDTILLLSGVTLAWITGINPLEQPWLATKLIALLLYIGLGMFAFRFAKTAGMQLVSWSAAIFVFCFMVSVAITKSPIIF